MVPEEVDSEVLSMQELVPAQVHSKRKKMTGGKIDPQGMRSCFDG
jgi:hypothetical protein